MKNIILASTSARRRALLEQIGLPFSVDDSVLEDTGYNGQEPDELVKEVSLNKAESVAEKYSDALIIAADTIGVIGGRIIGKPHSEQEAKEILSLLSGRAHTVITGFTVLDTANGKSVSKSVSTGVYFKTMTKQEIEAYVNTGEPLDKAGAYAIQGKGAVFVEKIDGDYFNVVGLPLGALVEVLKEFGVKVF
jgi:septum formation protein